MRRFRLLSYFALALSGTSPLTTETKSRPAGRWG